MATQSDRARKRPLPSPELLRELLRYDPEAGKVFWRARTKIGGGDPAKLAAWNTKFAGREALAYKKSDGYLNGTVFYTEVLAHRAIWAMVHGEWPDGDIDHLDHVRTNNRIENLRVVTQSENLKNTRLYRNNTSGVAGVVLQGSRWIAQIRHKGKQTHLGMFERFEDAVAARKRAESDFGFHPNHGRALIHPTQKDATQ